MRAGTRTLGQIALVTVPAPDHLLADGSGAFTPTAASGAPKAVSGATIHQGVLEGSNVDMAERDDHDGLHAAQLPARLNRDPDAEPDARDRQPAALMTLPLPTTPIAAPSGLPIVNQALEPASVRNGSPAVQKAYASALDFEAMLVQQLSQALTQGTGLGGEEGSEEGMGGASEEAQKGPLAPRPAAP